MDNRKNIRKFLICLGIPIVLIIIILLFFLLQPKTEQPKSEYKPSEIVSMFKEQQVKEYTLDFGSGELNIKKTDGTELKTSVASITLFLESVNPYIEEYNEKHPDNPMVYDWKSATDNS